ncbi:alpha/beta fold hydrolase [Sphingobacteriaceae bacterium WQ 2009]|uniref:Alpha/beta fold hydrolase n=1 Tax=Rhinopithecimicrobium faecis TaxID=2820698 RepID=A0A8T4H8U5_9SPHI|nr:alpha/beta fold hydrolase [Sphingobacteriaceae bacterium WQ 2009]
MKEVQITTYNSYAIAATIYEGLGNKIILIIASAIGVKQAYYGAFARYLANQGITVITFDYYGIGKSKPTALKHVNVSIAEWGKVDLDAVITYAYQHYPTARYVFLGHSVGGQLVGLSPYARQLDKIITVASQTGYWRYWPGSSKLRMFANWYFIIPLLTNIFGYLPSKRITGMENLPKKVALQWSSWCLSPNYLFDKIAAKELYYEQLTIPVYAVSIADDKFAPVAAVDWMSSQFTAAEVQRVHLEAKDFELAEIGHFGIFRNTFKNSFWKRLHAEISDR